MEEEQLEWLVEVDAELRVKRTYCVMAATEAEARAKYEAGATDDAEDGESTTLSELVRSVRRC